MLSSTPAKIGLATLIMMASVFLSRVMGLLREVVIAHTGGAQATVDAYQVAFVIPEILNHIAASGFLSITFIPIFTGYLVARREADGWQAFSLIMTVCGSLLLLLVITAWLLAPQLVDWLAPGWNDPELRRMAIRMTRIIIPAQLCFFAGGLLMAVQFAQARFFVPALAPLIYNLGIISGGLLLGPTMGMQGFAWGVLGGALVGNLGLQLWGAQRVGLRFRPSWNLRHPDLIRYVLLTAPLMVGLTATFSTEILLKLFGSYLPPGNIAALNYALRIMLMLTAFFGQAVGVASFPFLTRMAAQKQYAAMHQLLNQTLRYLALLLPVAAIIMVLRQEVILLLFQRGAFDADATRLTGAALLFLMPGAFAFAAQTVVSRGFYALQNTLTPAIYSTLTVVISLPLYMLGLRLGGIGGVAGAIALSGWLQVLLLYALWNHRHSNSESRAVYRFLASMLLLSLPLGAGLAWLRATLIAQLSLAGTGGSMVVLMLVSFAGGLLLLLCGYAGRIQEIMFLAEKALMPVIAFVKKYRSGAGRPG